MHQASEQAREIHLVSRPTGFPGDDNFKMVEVDLPELAEGQIQVKNLCMSVDPYMRPRMDLGDSYVEPFALNEVLDGQAIGVVVASRHPAWREGDEPCGRRARASSLGHPRSRSFRCCLSIRANCRIVGVV